MQTKNKNIILQWLVATLLILAISTTIVFASSQTTLDLTPPEITELLSEENGTEVILYGRATDSESNIIAYAFTNSTDEPTTWNTVNSNSIYETYTVTTSGTYYFWVKNESGAIRNKTIIITVPSELPQYTVIYNANGGSNAPANQIKIEGETLTLTTATPTRDGHAFLGWAETSGASTVVYQPGSTYEVDGNATLYAIWLADEFTITYNIDGAVNVTSIESQVKTYGEAITLADEYMIRRRYKVVGWATTKEKAENNEMDYELGDTYTENKNANLYAVWGSRLIPSIANAPVLGNGMEAVYWSDEDATTELTSSTFTSDMYNYTMGNGVKDTKQAKWANAKTTDDGSYWVWIPRYAYSLIYYEEEERMHETTSKTKYGDIDILFMYGLSNTHYRDINGNPQPLPESYKVHPAFQAMTTEEDLTTNPLGKWDTELEGIWVAKYEASREDSTDNGATWNPTTVNYGGSNNLTTNAGNTSATQIRVVSKPSVTSWRAIEQSNIYVNCENMYPTLNTHEMKNSEWGAVAYLTYSPYGRNGEELEVNECYDFYTGAGPGYGWYEYSETNVTNESGDTTAYAFDETYAWNTTQGKLASTTGNIYGIYDMSGGAYERVASYVNNGHTNLTKYGANMVNSSNIRNKQVYPSTVSDGTYAGEANYELAASIYGDAVYETSIVAYGRGWCYDGSYFPDGYSPFFERGGFCNIAPSAGVFCFYNDNGFSYNAYDGFRPVVCVSLATSIHMNMKGF